MFGRKKKIVDEPNPWLKMPHDHDWLEANNGAELVCGICGLRKTNEKGVSHGTSKESKS